MTILSQIKEKLHEYKTMHDAYWPVGIYLNEEQILQLIDEIPDNVNWPRFGRIPDYIYFFSIPVVSHRGEDIIEIGGTEK